MTNLNETNQIEIVSGDNYFPKNQYVRLQFFSETGQNWTFVWSQKFGTPDECNPRPTTTVTTDTATATTSTATTTCTTTNTRTTTTNAVAPTTAINALLNQSSVALSTGAIIGLSIGTIVLVTSVTAFGFYLFRFFSRKKMAKVEDSQVLNNQSSQGPNNNVNDEYRPPFVDSQVAYNQPAESSRLQPMPQLNRGIYLRSYY